MILVFESIHYVLAAEKRLMVHGVAYALVPTPKNVSAECGISVEIHPADEQAVVNALQGMYFEVFENL